MITVHHLNNSRSQRILWLLEELGIDYEIAKYQRDAETNLAPPELLKIHPLGKSPVITDGELTIHESAAIVDYLINRYGNGSLQPKPGTDDHVHYVEWMHYAEGSAMLPLLLNMYTSRLGDAAAPLTPRITSEINNHFSFMNNALEGREYFVGSNLTGADIMLSFPLEAAATTGALGDMPNLAAFVERMWARPAYLAALEKGGDYAYGPRT